MSKSNKTMEFTSKQSILRSATALFLSAGLAFMSFGLLNATIQIKAKAEGFSDWFIGILGAIFLGGFLLGCILYPKIIRRVQHARAFSIMTSLAASSSLLCFMIIDPFFWILMRLLLGFSLAGIRVNIESWLNDISTNDTRITLITSYIMIIQVLQASGQISVGYVNINSYEIFAIACILFCLAAIPVGLTQTKMPAPPQNTKINFSSLLQVTPIAAMGCFCAGLVNGPYWAYAGVYMIEKGYSLTEAPLFMAAIILGGALSQLPFGYITKYLGFKVTVFVLCSIGICASSIINLNPLTYNQLLLCAFSFGVSNWPIYSLSVGYANSYIDRKHMVEVASNLLLLFVIGSVAGALILAGISYKYSIEYFFAYMIVVQVLLLTYVLLSYNPHKYIRKRRSYDMMENQLLPSTRLLSTYYLDHTKPEFL